MLNISDTASLEVVGTNWITSAGNPEDCRPLTRQLWIAFDEWELSDPPLRITAFPDLKHRPPASAVTLGLLS